MDSEATPVTRTQDTTPASPGREGPPRTFLGAIAVVGASICIAVLALVLLRVSFWDEIWIPVIIFAGLALLVMHIFARIGRSLVATVVVGCGYLVAGAAILVVGVDEDPGPAILAAVAFLCGVLTLISAARAHLRAQRAPA